MKYSNLPLDITDIIKQMKSRGLSITDENKATTFLENVSYFRLAVYLRPMEIDASHNYKSGSTFENAISLYDLSGNCIIKTNKSDRLSTENISKGIYILYIESDNTLEIHKVLIK